MPTIHALYDSYSDALEALRALDAAGVPSDDVSILANRSDALPTEPSATAAGAELGADVGAIAGGAGGLLAGLGFIAVPGLGPLLGAGWLASLMVGFFGGAAAGLAVGGIAGALIEAGVAHEPAHAYEQALRHGGTLLVARVRDDQLEAAEAALETRRVDIAARQAKASGVAGPLMP